MAEALADVAALPGLGWIAVASFVAGLVYGFAGFGGALVFMPAASIFLPVAMAFAAFNVSALASFATVLPGALRRVDPRALATLILSATATAWIGLGVLRAGDPVLLRWAVVAVCAATLAALMAGWRRRVRPTRAAEAGIGAATGFIGGATGLLGPVMVLFQLSGDGDAAENRATILVFLSVTTALMLPLMALQGLIGAPALALGTALLVPYGAGSGLGAVLFRRGHEGLYRRVAYLVIFCAIVAGMPVWDR